MSDLVVGKTNVSNLLRKEYKLFGKQWITLLVSPKEHSLMISLESLKILIGELSFGGVYISLEKDYDSLLNWFKKYGIDSSKIVVVDAVSKSLKKEPIAKNCFLVSGPLNIDSILSKVYEALPIIDSGKKFVFLDSISSLMMYNSLPRTIRFSTFLAKKLKSMNVAGIMVSVSSGAENIKLIKQLSANADKVIEIKG